MAGQIHADASSDDETVTIWEPQRRQEAFITCPADDVGFGGARGGGKSDAVVGDFINHEDTYGEHAIAMAFRRERTQLVELIERAKQILRPIGYNWHEQDKYFRGPKGGRLRFTYLESDSDADAYQGHSYTRLYPEEIGTFPSEAPINKLQATLRSGQGVPCQMKGTCNPGGPGHQWVKARYRLDTHPKGFERFDFDFVNPFTKRKITKTRMFIPSKVTDNKFLGDDYVAQLFQVGSEQLVRAWLEGDWSVVEGAFFDNWSALRHVVRPFEIPAHWLRFRAGDWGSAKPFAFGWFAIASEEFRTPDGHTLPRGAMVQYREWYGVAEDSQGRFKPDTGLKLHADVVGKGVRTKDAGDIIAYGVLDPAAFAQDGGPSIAEMMQGGGAGSTFRPADNKRVTQRGAMGGWDQVRGRLAGDDDGRAMLLFFSTCIHSIRTIPALQHDPDKPEDLDTDAEDHAADMVRYACMSRPWIRKAPGLAPRTIQPGQVMLPGPPDPVSGARIRI